MVLLQARQEERSQWQQRDKAAEGRSAALVSEQQQAERHAASQLEVFSASGYLLLPLVISRVITASSCLYQHRSIRLH